MNHASGHTTSTRPIAPRFGDGELCSVGASVYPVCMSRCGWLAVLLASCGGTSVPASAPSRLVDQPIPRFEQASLGGGNAGTQTVQGKLLVVKFFANYCAPCKKTLPEAQRIAASQSDVQVIGIAEDELASEAQAVVRAFGLTFPVIHDPNNALANRFGIQELPATFVADPGGTVRWVGGPDQSRGDLSAALAWLRSQLR
jgi:peroxiredoxin